MKFDTKHPRSSHSMYVHKTMCSYHVVRMCDLTGEDGSKDVVEFFVFLSEIVNIGHCLSSTVVPPYMLLRTTAVCGYRLRSQFRMSQLVEGYFDPEISGTLLLRFWLHV